jgi:endogenous inhibitor of DNA gyrase (YacG/DUF329 family)
MKTDTEIMKEMALQQFRERVLSVREIPKIDNSSLMAGEPMYFYCSCCGIQTEVLREDFLFRPFSKCSQCLGLDQMGWLDEAVKSVG